MEISKQLKLARIEKNLTQQELADLLGVTRPYISRYESGNMDLGAKRAQLIAQALGKEFKLLDK